MSSTSTAGTTRITVKVPAEIHKAVRVLRIERDTNLAELVAEALKLLLAQGRGGEAGADTEPGVAP